MDSLKGKDMTASKSGVTHERLHLLDECCRHVECDEKEMK